LEVARISGGGAAHVRQPHPAQQLAWELANAALPLAVTADPPGLAPAGAPRVELPIINEPPTKAACPTRCTLSTWSTCQITGAHGS
jgi:hypothetical protein